MSTSSVVSSSRSSRPSVDTPEAVDPEWDEPAFSHEAAELALDALHRMPGQVEPERLALAGEPDRFDQLSDIWAECLLESKADGGVLTSLQSKGLARFQSNGGTVGSLKSDDTVRLTQAGWDVYVNQIKGK